MTNGGRRSGRSVEQLLEAFSKPRIDNSQWWYLNKSDVRLIQYALGAMLARPVTDTPPTDYSKTHLARMQSALDDLRYHLESFQGVVNATHAELSGKDTQFSDDVDPAQRDPWALTDASCNYRDPEEHAPAPEMITVTNPSYAAYLADRVQADDHKGPRPYHQASGPACVDVPEWFRKIYGTFQEEQALRRWLEGNWDLDREEMIRRGNAVHRETITVPDDFDPRDHAADNTHLNETSPHRHDIRYEPIRPYRWQDK